MTIKLKYNPKLTSLVILGICLTGLLIGTYVQRFRISDYRWIYQYGSFLNLVIVFGSIAWSLLHPLLVWFNRKAEWKKNLIWILIGLIPVLYFLIRMAIAMIK